MDKKSRGKFKVVVVEGIRKPINIIESFMSVLNRNRLVIARHKQIDLRLGSAFCTLGEKYFSSLRPAVWKKQVLLQPVVMSCPAGHYKGNACIFMPAAKEIIEFWNAALPNSSYKILSRHILHDMLYIELSDINALQGTHLHLIDASDLHIEYRSQQFDIIDSLKRIAIRIHGPQHKFVLRCQAMVEASIGTRLQSVSTKWLKEQWLQNYS